MMGRLSQNSAFYTVNSYPIVIKEHGQAVKTGQCQKLRKVSRIGVNQVNFIVGSKYQEYSFVKPSAGGCSQFFSSYVL